MLFFKMVLMSQKLNIKVLMIEDDDSFFNLLCPHLKKAGVVLARAKNGKDGISKAKSEHPKLIITDVIIPKTNGFEVIKNLKENKDTSNIKFIILTNYGETSLVYNEDFLDSLGISKYLIKSNHSPTEIVTEVVSVLN